MTYGGIHRDLVRHGAESNALMRHCSEKQASPFDIQMPTAHLEIQMGLLVLGATGRD